MFWYTKYIRNCNWRNYLISLFSLIIWKRSMRAYCRSVYNSRLKIFFSQVSNLFNHKELLWLMANVGILICWKINNSRKLDFFLLYIQKEMNFKFILKYYYKYTMSFNCLSVIKKLNFRYNRMIVTSPMQFIYLLIDHKREYSSQSEVFFFIYIKFFFYMHYMAD